MNPKFYFITCQFGAEKAVKEEVLTAHPGLKFAFSRPGFVTFKDEAGNTNLSRPGTFTRLIGTSLLQTKEGVSVQELLSQIPDGALVHAFDRDLYVPGDEPEGFALNSHIGALLTEIYGKTVPPFRLNEKAKLGERVYDLIWIDEGKVFLGEHVHKSGFDPSPGNRPDILLPPESPSRAYLKLEEAIHRFQPTLKPAMTALEVGCSPGGATLAMLNRGFKVTGIDPKFMHESILKNPNYRAVQKLASKVNGYDLREVNPEWVVMDINLAPLEALDELNHVLKILRAQLGPRLKVEAGFLTLKLNDWKFVSHIPLYLKRIQELGFRDLHCMQLCSNRQEFMVFCGGWF